MTKRNKKFIEINETQNEQDIDMDEFLMQRVADAIWDEELKALDEACEKYKDLDFEEDEDTRLQAIFDKRDEIEKKRNAAKKTKRFAKVAAVVVLALGVFGTAGYFSTTEAFRAELLNLIFKTHDRYDEIVVDENQENLEGSAEDEESGSGEAEDRFALQLDYLPDGYKLVEMDANHIVYEDVGDKEKFILLSYRDPDRKQHMDNERAYSEIVFRNGCEIKINGDGIGYTAMWQDRGQHFVLSVAYMDKDILLKVFEGIRWTEDN